MKPDSWERIGELFEAALGLAPEERAAFLDEACSGQDALRARVEELLANHEQAEANGFLDRAPLVNSMELSPGTELGHYKLVRLIGAGGMGQVYQATDTRLDRSVAIKVLPSHVASNRDVRARFEREARTISQLNHPHICTLYDVGQENGVDFLVMEYIEGETLAERLGKGALPLDQALQHGIEIADALDKAHRNGVVHRDLKPGNIMLTKSGAKLLDFGLAKLMPEPSKRDPDAATVTKMTREGAIIGTLQYMAPEQVEGKKADARTDIFAFGSVLYEMVTGQRAFEGKSQASLIGAILKDEPPSISSAPPAVDHVIRMCLAKDPDERWQSASNVMAQLKWIFGEASSPTVLPSGETKSRLIPAIATGIAAALLAGIAVWALMEPHSPEPTRRLSITLPAEAPLAGWLGNPGTLALSPDGSRLVYTAVAGDQRQLYLRPLDQLDATPLPGTTNATSPFFSPDGEWVGFLEVPGGKLKKVPVLGGQVTTLYQTGGVVLGASWSTDNTIIFAAPGERGQFGLFQVPASGGAPKALTIPDSANDEGGHAWPEVLPNRNALLFSIGGTTGAAPNRIAVLSLESGEYHTVLEGGYSPRYAPSGHLLYLVGETLMAAPFDLENLKTTGSSAPVIDGISGTSLLGFNRTRRPRGTGSFALSTDGSIAYLPVPKTLATLVWVERDGRETPLVKEPLENPRHIRLSPDGRRLALVAGQDDPQLGDLWVYYLDNRPPTRLTFDGTNDRPVWILDGTELAFSSQRTGARELYSIPADGSRLEPELLLSNSLGKWTRAWAPQTEELVFDQFSPGTTADMMAISINGEREPRILVQTKAVEGLSAVSSDGRWLAHVSNLSGPFEVFVRPFSGSGAPVRVSTKGGLEPVWGPGDRELYYVEDGDNRMMAVKVSTEPTLTFGPPEVVLEGPYSHDYQVSAPTYDVGTDGRFLMIKPVAGEESDPTELVVILNWFEELKRLVPTE